MATVDLKYENVLNFPCKTKNFTLPKRDLAFTLSF